MSGVVSIPLSSWQRSSASYTSHLFSPVAITYRRYCGIAGEHYQRAMCADEGAGVAAPTTMTADATRSAAGQNKHGKRGRAGDVRPTMGSIHTSGTIQAYRRLVAPPLQLTPTSSLRTCLQSS